MKRDCCILWGNTLTLYPVTGFMPTLPPGLTEWLPSGFITAFLGLLWYEQKAGEARLNKRGWTNCGKT